ncbi:MAG: hypothetical protein WCY32_13390 [Burkholderiaceae bacterium]
MFTRPRSFAALSARRAFLRTGAGAALLAWLSPVLAKSERSGRNEWRAGQSQASRLAPDEHDRLRRDLRQRGMEGWPAGSGRTSRQAPERGRGRLSDDERRQLRRQVREAEKRQR